MYLSLFQKGVFTSSKTFNLLDEKIFLLVELLVVLRPIRVKPNQKFSHFFLFEAFEKQEKELKTKGAPCSFAESSKSAPACWDSRQTLSVKAERTEQDSQKERKKQKTYKHMKSLIS